MLLPLIFAFQIGSPVSGACHEAITLAASSQAGFPEPSAAPRPTENQARALEDLTFDLPADRRDVTTMTLVIGVRSNDLHDNALSDVAALIAIHDDPWSVWIGFAMPTPQVTGVPFYYRQYRITVGAEYRF